MKRTYLACLALAGALLTTSATSAGIIEEFKFNESSGVLLGAAVNSANAGNNWLVHASTVESAMNGTGAFNIQKNSVLTQASNALEIANITSGTAYLVVDIAGWNYTPTASTTSERVRFAFLDNDPASTGGSTVTAEMNIDRLGNALTLRGEAIGTGATTLLGTQYALPLVQTNPLRLILELNKDADTYAVHYKDGAGPLTSLGSGSLGDRSAGVKREGRSIRFAFTGGFGDTGEFFNIDRIFLSTTPIPEPGTLLLTLVAATGIAFLRKRSS